MLSRELVIPSRGRGRGRHQERFHELDRSEHGEVKFLVRLDDGEELVLVHDQKTGRWRRD